MNSTTAGPKSDTADNYDKKLPTSQFPDRDGIISLHAEVYPTSPHLSLCGRVPQSEDLEVIAT